MSNRTEVLRAASVFCAFCAFSFWFLCVLCFAFCALLSVLHVRRSVRSVLCVLCFLCSQLRWGRGGYYFGNCAGNRRWVIKSCQLRCQSSTTTLSPDSRPWYSVYLCSALAGSVLLCVVWLCSVLLYCASVMCFTSSALCSVLLLVDSGCFLLSMPWGWR